MNWTKEILAQLHPVYRDFMLALRPVAETRGKAYQVSGIHRTQLFSALRMAGHAYGPDEVGDELEKADLVRSDALGFFVPTAKGRELIDALVGQSRPPRLPPLPQALKD